MKKLNPIERSIYINERYKGYLKSSFQFGNDKMNKLFEDEIEKEDLFKGPYVDLNLPFKRGKSIDELISEGIISSLFYQLDDINYSRPLYFHQEEAIRNIGQGRGAIITTGTGSGKTECFLYPILNDILKDIEKGNNEIGIRAIFLYPMNALVNDQMDRVRKILSHFPEIKYGYFTGDTEEKGSLALRKKLEEQNGTKIPPNELVARDEIRKTPPHLLFTNYSMLEYLLIRPSDSSIFKPEYLKNWHYVILDEAHTYNGSLGIELSMLMRRLTALAKEKPRFILTSATLGEKHKSENEIIKFAKNLTSGSFEIKDIIFSSRILLNDSLVSYRVKGNDYIDIKNNLNNIDKLSLITNKYNINSSLDTKELIYKLLIKDENVYDIYFALKKGCLTFYKLLEKINYRLKDNELISLIDLINFAEKNGIGIFDLKYHSFIRPLSGAYVTLGANQKLTLTKTNKIGDLKAFEIGNCRYCNTPYIIGKMQRNSKDGLQYLYQNKEIDIYENYGENDSVRIDYFLMDKKINEDEIDSSLLEEYEVCSKCGEIHPKGNLNASNCKCDESNRITIYKVNQNKKSDNYISYNNINICPCCGHKSQSGIVKSLNLGKDEGTALVAQILYEAIDEEEQKEKKKEKLSLSLNSRLVKEPDKKKVKQFLSFSDSRQQASFSAVFLNSNHIRMLQKRLIWKVIEDQHYRNINVDELAAYLTQMIKTKNLFHNNLSSHKNAWITILRDLLKIDGTYDGEGLGLYYFELDLSDIADGISEEAVDEELSEYHLNKNELLTLIQVVFTIFKTTPAMNYVKSTLTPDEKKEYLEYRRFDNYVMYKASRSSLGVKSLIPIQNTDNIYTRYIKKACHCDREAAIHLLDIIFNSLAVVASELNGSEGILIKHENKDAYQANSSRYILKNYKNSKYYYCKKCGRLTPYNVHNVCTQDKCDGTLIEVNPDEILDKNFYRNQYKNMKIESIVIEEHTAQLERQTAKQYQNDFKNKKINILSCSTTFEMGIDLGELETVFMRNVPPTPANYVQRAGRAGRRKDSSAYVLTYCDVSSHDYTYFVNPEKMISGVINPPYFNVLNKKIILRHLMAISLGYFFRENPEYFKTIDNLVFHDGYIFFKQYLNSIPKDLIEFIDNKVIPESIFEGYHNFKWYESMNQNDEKMNYFISSIKEMDNEYELAKQKALSDDNFQEANYYNNQIKHLHNLKVIDSLSKYCVIPKYGFPVDVVDLQIYENGILLDKYDLNRDLRIAISEYAPDSEIIVDKRKYTSKYITLPKTGEFKKNYYCSCPKCKKINISISDRLLRECTCGQDLSKETTKHFIEPIYGFKTGITKESTRMKPKRSYSGEVSYLGGGIKDDTKLLLTNVLSAESSSNDKLMIINKSYFYMCPVCGYSEIYKGGTMSPIISSKHKNYRQYDCVNDKLELLKIGHIFQTDVVRLNIPLLSTQIDDSFSIALSFLYSLLEGISNGLEIERNDLDGIVEINNNTKSYDILLFDNVPGGAGHVKRLMKKESIIISLQSALKKVSQDCCDEETSCYNCLRNYYNQSYHSKLKRKYAKVIIVELLKIQKDI